MTTNELQAFCHRTRPEVQSPFSVGAWTVATNGALLLRVPRLADVPENPDAPTGSRIEELFNASFQAEPTPLPDTLPPRLGDTPCSECNGSGSLGDVECYYCRGGVIPEKKQRVRVGGEDFPHVYLHQVAGLPGVRFYLATEPGEPARFTCDGGGEGLLAPMRPQY